MTDDEIDAAIRAIVPAECFRANAVAREIYRAGYLAGYKAGASECEGVTALRFDGGTQ